MRQSVTTICCVSMLALGYMIVTSGDVNDNQEYLHSQNTIHAANVPSWNYNGPLPLDLKLNAAKKLKTDTVFIHDTVTVNNTKYVRVPVPKHTTDTIYVPLTDLPEIEVMPVKNKNPGDRKEETLDEMPHGSKPGIVLIVDGNTVYTSKNDTHSGDSTSVVTASEEP